MAEGGGHERRGQKGRERARAYADLFDALQAAEAGLARPVNPTVLTPAEWRHTPTRGPRSPSRSADREELDREGPVRRRLLARIQGEVSRRGVIDVLRHELKHGPVHLDLFYGSPASGEHGRPGALPDPGGLEAPETSCDER